MELLEKTINRFEAGSRGKLFEDLYVKAFPKFARFASNRNASFLDAKDIFHDALVIYYEKCLEPGFEVHTSQEAYVVGIAKHLWIRKFHRDRQQVSIDTVEEKIAIPPDYFPDAREVRLLTLLEQSGKRCMDLLRKFYYEKTPLRQIASALGYRTEHSATVQKYKCIGKLREAIKTQAINYEDFH